YGVQITELRLDVGIGEKLSRQDILQSLEQAKKDGHVTAVETVRLSILEQHEARVQFTKRVPVTAGTATAGPERTVRNVQQRDVGTMVQLSAQTQGAQVLLQLMYESSRIEGESSDDAPAPTHTVQFSTTLLITPGQPLLVGSTNSDKSTLLLVTIEP
ncbi:MAG TPA: hypothetical protein VFQ26_02410, partial [Nitrospiraceae bacterium]|nr:hypothetical protein [Nitrospiraceae bacterium]